MKLADGYMICEVAGSFCLLPVGQNVADCNHIFNLNETGYFLCSQLKEDLTYAQLLERMAAEYEVNVPAQERPGCLSWRAAHQEAVSRTILARGTP